MPSATELRKEMLAEAEKKHGPDNPFVKGLKMQIARAEKPRAENPVDSYSAGSRGITEK